MLLAPSVPPLPPQPRLVTHTARLVTPGALQKQFLGTHSKTLFFLSETSQFLLVLHSLGSLLKNRPYTLQALKGWRVDNSFLFKSSEEEERENSFDILLKEYQTQMYSAM